MEMRRLTLAAPILAAVLAAHRSPHPNLAKLGKRRVVGNTVRTPLPTMKWINKPFAQLLPEDFETYIDDRCEEVLPSTVDRELDVFSAVCNIAIDTWRIHVAKNPMHGVRRPKYFNERDRRVRADEEAALMQHAFEADRAWSIERRFGQLMAEAHAKAAVAGTTYARKAIVKEARAKHRVTAEASFERVPIFSAFIQFQLMTGARRGETLSLEWKHVDLERQTAYLPETKNGRPRTLPLRRELVELLLQLPRDGINRRFGTALLAEQVVGRKPAVLEEELRGDRRAERELAHVVRGGEAGRAFLDEIQQRFSLRNRVRKQIPDLLVLLGTLDHDAVHFIQ